MTDRDYAPLTVVCVRTLSDKVYEKRKAAALEIEKLTRECVAIDDHTQIQRVVKLLSSDFASSPNPNLRKGTLLGLASVSIALGPQINRYVEDLVKPVLMCMADTDSRVRYYACESLYNVMKVAREQILPLFNDVYAAMSSTIADVDLSVRAATELLIKLSMNIVTEQPSFPVESLMPVIRKQMYSKNEFSRMFHLAWISAFKQVPDAKIFIYLPDILDQLFVILSDEKRDIRTRCEVTMIEFLEEIKAAVRESRENDGQVESIGFQEMANILVVHAQSDNVNLQIMASQWILEFIRLSRFQMLPHVSGILTALLPNLVIDDDKRRNMSDDQCNRILGLSSLVNTDLMKLVKSAEKLKDSLPNDESADLPSELKDNQLELEPLIDVLSKQLQRGRVETKLAVLRWFYLLFKISQQKMVKLIDSIFPTLLKTLSDTSDEVVFVNIQVLAEICSLDIAKKNKEDDTNPYFKQFLLSLLELFSANKTLLETKGSFIIRQLCVLLSPEDIYCHFANLLVTETNLKFAKHMVETLNTILLTTTELFLLRDSLRKVGTTERSCDLFQTLYRTWCHSQVATVALCFLAGCYKHAGDLVVVISKEEVTMEMLKEVDKLIQLLESPIFASMRMELLDLQNNGDLLRALQALLMFIPQTTAFRTLSERLNCLRKVRELSDGKEVQVAKAKPPPSLDYDQLLEHYKNIQKRHMEEAMSQKQVAQMTYGVKSLDLSDGDDNDVEW